MSGTIRDLVTFHMLKPIQGASVAALPGMTMPSVEASDNSPAPELQGGEAIGQAIAAPFAKGTPATPAPAEQEEPVASDETLKQNIEPGKEKVDQFLNNLGSHEYEYKEPTKDGIGKFFSPMAQELEKAGPVGKSMVIDTPRGKMVDYQRGFGMQLSALAAHNEEIKQLQNTVSKLQTMIKKKKS